MKLETTAVVPAEGTEVQGQAMAVEGQIYYKTDSYRRKTS